MEGWVGNDCGGHQGKAEDGKLGSVGNGGSEHFAQGSDLNRQIQERTYTDEQSWVWQVRLGRKESSQRLTGRTSLGCSLVWGKIALELTQTRVKDPRLALLNGVTSGKILGGPQAQLVLQNVYLYHRIIYLTSLKHLSTTCMPGN